jgi:hypothetical protein
MNLSVELRRIAVSTDDDFRRAEKTWLRTGK